MDLVSDLPEHEASRVQGALLSAGIPAEKAAQTAGQEARYRIRVERGLAASAVRVLQQHHLPRPQAPGLSEALGKSGLLSSAALDQARLAQGLSGELAQTLMRVDGVAEARVHLVLPRSPGLLAADASASTGARASVLLVLGRAGALSEAQVRTLISGAVAGLKPEAVQVVTLRLPSNRSSPLPGGEALVSLGPFQVAAASRLPLGLVLGAGLLAILVLGALLLRLRSARSRSTDGDQAAQRQARDLESSLSLLSRSIKPGGRTDGKQDP